jgi:hypothetical protein
MRDSRRNGRRSTPRRTTKIMANRLTECAIELRFEKRGDGRIAVSSPDLPGLHLVGPDSKSLRGDVEPAMRDILAIGSNLAVDTILRLPALGNAIGPFNGGLRREICVVTFKPPA